VAALVAVAPGEVAGDAPAAVFVRRVVGAADGEPLERPKVGLDSVQPARVGGRVDGLGVVGSHEGLQAGVLVGVEVVHYDVEADLQRVARPQPREDGEEVVDRLTLAHLADEAVGVDIVERQQLLGAVQPPIRRAEALGMADLRPAAPSQWSQFKRAALVEADDRPTCGAALVEVEDTVFFTSNSGSGDSFQVLVCW